MMSWRRNCLIIQARIKSEVTFMERKSYLVGHSFRFHMFAAIMTMTAMNLNSIIDGILMGNFLGPDAFSAINIVMPIVNCIGALGILLAQGPAIRTAKYLGAMKHNRANQVVTVSIASMLVFGAIFSVVVALTGLAVPTVNLLCVAKDLQPLALEYAAVLMAGSVLLIFDNGLSVLVDVMGNPRVVTIGTLIKTATNILFDILTVKVFGMDISGAALATLLGALAGDVFFMIYIFKRSGLKLCACPKWLKDLGQGVLQSIPAFIGALSTVALLFICNYFIMANQGSDGMFVISIGYTLISIGSMISNGVGMSYTAIGSMLMGQEDYYGMRVLVRRGILVTLIPPVCFMIASMFSRTLATLFGANTPELLDLSQRAIPLICIMLFSLGIISSMVSLHTVLGHQTVSTINTLFMLVSVLLAFIAVQVFLPPDQIWMAFPAATIISLLVFFADTSIICIRSKVKLQTVTLIPKILPSGKLFDVSVECNMEAKDKSMKELQKFLRDNNVGTLEDNIHHCLDEMMINILNHSDCAGNAYMDLFVIIRDDKITASLRNIGKPFDPTKLDEAERKIGLKIVFHYCTNVDYRYSYGQNVVVTSWSLPSEVSSNSSTEIG